MHRGKSDKTVLLEGPAHVGAEILPLPNVAVDCQVGRSLYGVQTPRQELECSEMFSQEDCL